MMELKYYEILKLNKELKNNFQSSPFSITVLSNIIVHQIKDILEYILRSEVINANVGFGDYDNIVQNSLKYKDTNAVIIFWELSNIVDGLQFRIELLRNDQLDAILEKTKSEIDLVLKNLEKTPLVLINKFTSLSFFSLNIRKNHLDKLADQLNQYLENKIQANIKLIELGKIIANLGLDKSLNLRDYYSSKALYKVDFFKTYVEYIKPIFMSVNGKAKKAIIFDCDNTLWKGTLGEDGFNNIEMSSRTKDGAIFAEIQSIALALSKQGILIGLCSKNNSKDVDEVIESHLDMQLKNEHITINKSNWLDKVSNLKEIAQELNIGLDSLVFIDDSSFEVNLIREQVPEITVLQVPERLYEYPKMLRESLNLFYSLSFTSEDSKKINMYKNQVKRETVKKEFTDIEDYLASLGLKITIFENDESIVPRISQLSQKTNQFNLTTKRYTDGDILKFIEDPNVNVFAFSVSDKFGDSGLIGLSIVFINNQKISADINTLLMSCRIIGRNIEFAFMDYLVGKMREKKINKVKAQYIKTQKNEQVEDFYDKCSFELIDRNDLMKNYVLDVKNYQTKKIKYIDMVYE